MTLDEVIDLINESIKINEEMRGCKNNEHTVDTYEVSIRSNGKKTRASLKHNGKPVCSAKATTHPQDEDDFYVGTSLALKRLFEKAVIKDELEDIADYEKGRAEDLVSDKLKRRGCIDLFKNEFKEGDIVKIYSDKNPTKEIVFNYDLIFKFPFNCLKNGWAIDPRTGFTCVVINSSVKKCKCNCEK